MVQLHLNFKPGRPADGQAIGISSRFYFSDQTRTFCQVASPCSPTTRRVAFTWRMASKSHRGGPEKSSLPHSRKTTAFGIRFVLCVAMSISPLPMQCSSGISMSEFLRSRKTNLTTNSGRVVLYVDGEKRKGCVRLHFPEKTLNSIQ